MARPPPDAAIIPNLKHRAKWQENAEYRSAKHFCILHPAWIYLMLSPSQRKESWKIGDHPDAGLFLNGPLNSINQLGDIVLGLGTVSHSHRDGRSLCKVWPV